MMNSFAFLSPHPQLTFPYATGDRKFATMAAHEICDLQAALPQRTPNEHRVNEVSDFLRTFGQNWNARRSNDSPFTMLKPPELLNSTRGVSSLPPGEVLQSIRLTRIESLLTQDDIEIREAEICLSVDIPP